jgi:hypothetical protein
VKCGTERGVFVLEERVGAGGLGVTCGDGL